jgi:hypothetical protein
MSAFSAAFGVLPGEILANELCQLLDDGPQFALLND